MSLAARLRSAWRALRGSRAYFKGAEVGRLNQEWILGPVSADKTIRFDVPRLRERARQLARDNSYVRRYLKASSGNVIGADGIRLQADVRSGDRIDTETNRKIEAAWREWGNGLDALGRHFVSVDGSMGIAEWQRHVFEAWLLDGEVFIRIVSGADNDWGFALQLIDADQVDINYNEIGGKSRNAVVMGVELDEWRRPVAYHVLQSPAGETLAPHERTRARIPAAEVIHLYRPERVNQTRGVPSLAPTINDLRHLDGYIEAELVAARTGAAKMGFFSPPPGDFSEDANKTQPLTMEANPGTIEELPPGYTFTPWSPDHPAAAFPAFVKAILRRASSGLGIPYVTLANDLEGVNYSSIRQGELAARDEWRVLQKWFASIVLDRVYRAWLKQALLANKLDLSAREAAAGRYHAIRWLPRGWQWVDPLKDIQAALLAIEGGLATRTGTAAESSDDFEEIVEKLAEEQALAKEHGVDLSAKKQAPKKQGEALHTPPSDDMDGKEMTQ